MNSTEEYRSLFTYPNNYADPNLQQLTAKNAIALPVTQILKKVVNGSANTYDKVKYDYDSQGKIVKEYIFDNSITADTVKWNREYTYLPNSNKICQVKSRGSFYTTYLWSYQSNFPVAKVEGASESEIGSLINITALRSSITDSYIISTVTQLKNLLPVGKIATTYLYDPIYGITEIRDFNDISTFYTYDEFGRLRLIKEYNSFIKNRFIYNYGTN